MASISDFEATASANHKGLKFDFLKYDSYVHLPSNIMKELDKVYLEHFQGSGLTLLDCFDLYQDENRVPAFLSYLESIRVVLCQVLEATQLKGHDPLSFGLKGACIRLNPLFHPLEGRINLPLTTTSMLEDLKKCSLTEGNHVVREVYRFEANRLTETDHVMQVSRWLEGLSSHMMNTKGHPASAQVWSDVIANKLQAICPLESPTMNLSCKVGSPLKLSDLCFLQPVGFLCHHVSFKEFWHNFWGDGWMPCPSAQEGGGY